MLTEVMKKPRDLFLIFRGTIMTSSPSSNSVLFQVFPCFYFFIKKFIPQMEC